MKSHIIVLVCAVLFLSGCEELAPRSGNEVRKQSTAEKLKPTPKNTFDQLMEKSGHNINYILYGLLNYDEVKVKRGSDNIIHLCRLMKQRMPDYVIDDPEERDRWEETYKEQSQIAENINYRFEESNYDAARTELKNLLKNCMSCHADIEVGVADVTFIGPKNPSMDHALTEVMDSDNVNFNVLLFGLVANDMSESQTAINNIKRTSALMMHKIPDQYKPQKEQWDRYCNNQREAANRVAESIKADKTDELWDNVQGLLKECMGCHSLYRPGINL